MSERYTDRPGEPFGAAPDEAHPFVVMIYERPCVKGYGPHEHVREGVHNGLSFATAEDARAYALDLQGRWFGFDHFDVVNLVDPLRCRYDDCPEGHPVVPEEDDGVNTQRVTCPTCREDMGLPSIEEADFNG